MLPSLALALQGPEEWKCALGDWLEHVRPADEAEFFFNGEAFELFVKRRPSSNKQRTNEEVFLKDLTPGEQEQMRKALEKEWHKISVEKKDVVRVLSVEESERVRREKPHLLIPSRVVYTWKLGEATELMSSLGEREAKGRWTIKGYASPHLEEEFLEGKEGCVG